MKVFTYSQYIKCIHSLRLNAVLQLAEESAEYNLNKTKKKYSHDKLVKHILKDKRETAEFINQFLEPKEEVKEGELVRYTNSYITKKYKAKEADLVYKLKSREIFFLIEHQSTIDNNMLYRMLNYCIDIMQEWSRNRKIRRNTSYPIVVPIIIYTGKQKWKMPKNFKEKQIGDYVFERYKIDLEYNFIDINKLSKQLLLEKDSMFGYAMFLEKAENKEELVENLDVIIKSTDDERKLEEVANMIVYLLDDALEQKEQQELLEKISKKVGEKSMTKMDSLLQRLATEDQRYIELGKKAKTQRAVRNMLKLEMEEQTILKVLEIEKEELEEIKNRLKAIG